jgi:hypothetical protein
MAEQDIREAEVVVVVVVDVDVDVDVSAKTVSVNLLHRGWRVKAQANTTTAGWDGWPRKGAGDGLCFSCRKANLAAGGSEEAQRQRGQELAVA